MSGNIRSYNFKFMRIYSPQFDRLGALAERYFQDDPNGSLTKLRQFGELLAQEVAARVGLYTSTDEPQSDLLRRLKAERAAPPEAMDLFHQIRIAGNQAAHAHANEHGLALTTLKITRELSVWFHRTFGHSPGFKPGPFVPPSSPESAEASLREELAGLRTTLNQQLSREEQIRAEAEAARGAQESAEERAVWEKLAQEAEDAKTALAAQLAALQGAAEETTAQQKAATIREADEAAKAIHLDEAATRAIIDQQLRERGWEVDSVNLRHAKGARPVRGRAMAIAEWPTALGSPRHGVFLSA